MQFLLWPDYSPDVTPIENVWNLVGRHLARDPRFTVSKEEFLLSIQVIYIFFFSKADIKNLFDSMPRRIVALTAANGGYTK